MSETNSQFAKEVENVKVSYNIVWYVFCKKYQRSLKINKVLNIG